MKPAFNLFVGSIVQVPFFFGKNDSRVLIIDEFPTVEEVYHAIYGPYNMGIMRPS